MTVRTLLSLLEFTGPIDLLDPAEPDYDGGRPVAQAYFNREKGNAYINSFAHGGDDGSRVFDLTPALNALRTAETLKGVALPQAKATKDKPEPKKVWDIEFPQLNRYDEPVTTSVANAYVCLKHLGISAWYDEFRMSAVVEGLPRAGAVLDDHVISEIWLRIQAFNFYPSKGHIHDAVDAISRGDKRHPIRDWLDGLSWDRKPRLDNLFAEYAKAEGTPYQRACGVLLLVAMVRRVRQPGAKYDHVIILKGAQGSGKSGFFELLAGEQYFTDSFSFGLDDKTTIEQTEGMWLAEAAEMRGLKSKDIEHVKALVTRKTDRARKAYGRVTTSAPRQFVAVATTNNEALYSDHTGGRRWDIVEVKGFDWDAIKRDREQLFAEAAELEKSFGPLVLPENVAVEAEAIQEKHRIIDPVHAALERALEGRSGFISQDELYCAMDLGHGKEHLRHNQRYSVAMQEVTAKLGWRPYRLYVSEKHKRPYGYTDDNVVAIEELRKAQLLSGTALAKNPKQD